MSEHTLGKLTAAGPSKPTLDTPKGGDFAILDQDGKIIAETFAQVDYTEARPAEANARRIVTAWNAHDDLLTVCKALEKAEASYRLTHDLHGGGSPESGRAWDKLRRCGDKVRAAIALTKEPA